MTVVPLVATSVRSPSSATSMTGLSPIGPVISCDGSTGASRTLPSVPTQTKWPSRLAPAQPPTNSSTRDQVSPLSQRPWLVTHPQRSRSGDPSAPRWQSGAGTSS